MAANSIDRLTSPASAASSVVRDNLNWTYRRVGRCLKGIASFISSVAAAPLLPIGDLMECNALLGRHPTRGGFRELDDF